MIVTDQNVSDALSYLADDPSPLSRAKWEFRKAEADARQAFAKAFLAADGSVDARKCLAELNPDYITAKSAESDAEFEVDRHKDLSKRAETIIEIWRSENANARAAERLR